LFFICKAKKGPGIGLCNLGLPGILIMVHNILSWVFLGAVFFIAVILIVKFWVIPARGFIQLSVFTLSEIGFICNAGIPCSNCLLSFGICPIGTIQRITFMPGFPIYIVLLSVIAIGLILGTLTCSWLCPVGFIQDVFRSLRLKEIKINNKLKIIRNFTLVTVAVLIFLELQFNLLAKNRIGIFEEATILTGAILLLFAVFIKRPLCRFICPVGFIYGKLNVISPVKVVLKRDKCSTCRNCEKVCISGIKPQAEANNELCVKCFNCSRICNSKENHF